MFKSFTLITLTIIMLPVSKINSQEVWEKLTSPTTSLLKKVFFTDSLNGWACGSDGVIVHTSNGGNTWETQDSHVETFITDIFFLNENSGWALTQKNAAPFGTIILKTSNGGETWLNENYFENNIFMNTVFFYDSLTGWLGGSYIARTTDGGKTWVKADIDSGLISGLPVYNFDFFNKQLGYACGGYLDLAGVIWKTTDSGKNWFANGVSADQVYDMYLSDSLHVMALSGDPEGFYSIRSIKTSDAGKIWNFEDTQLYGISFSLDFRTPLEGWSASGLNFIFTSDGGDTWIAKPTPDSSIIYDFQFVNSQTGYAVGDTGVIYKYTSPPVSVDDEYSLPDQFVLYQNYPNPLNPVTKIRYTIAPPNLLEGEAYVGTSFMKFTTLKIYDVLGNEVATLVNEQKPAGSYEIGFNGGNLPSGIYFYQLRVGNFVSTKKMILLR